MSLILIVDDDDLIVEIVGDALRARGHIVGSTSDGHHVVDIVTFKQPAVVVLDCAMPTMSGIEVLRKIRSSAACFDTPVLMLTGRRSDADEEIALRAGANGYLRKPVDIAKLVDRIESLILEAECYPRTASM